MFICEKCFKTLGMESTKAKLVGSILTCQICNKESKAVYHVKDADALVFVLQVMYNSIKASQNTEEETAEDTGDETPTENTQIVTEEDSVTITDETNV